MALVSLSLPCMTLLYFNTSSLCQLEYSSHFSLVWLFHSCYSSNACLVLCYACLYCHARIEWYYTRILYLYSIMVRRVTLMPRTRINVHSMCHYYVLHGFVAG